MTDRSLPTAADGALISKALLAWYTRVRRDLPWRRQPSPYKTLVSEFMLQQTVVATVIPYFERFLKRFPGFPELAAAAEEDVTALWSGLGYYARARNLHRVAQAVCDHHCGVLPADEATLLTLPGIGPYTAAAIAAIAFGHRTFALDGNATRVVARLTDDDAPIDQPEARVRLRTVATEWVPKRRAGDFAQAVMELGATVCRPKNPDCFACPLLSVCRAARSGRVDTIPVKSPKKAKREIRWAVLRIEANGWVALQKRPPGLLAGTWLPPAVELAAHETPMSSVCSLVGSLAAAGALPSAFAQPQFIETVVHVFTHRQLTAEVFEVTTKRRPVSKTAADDSDWRWARTNGKSRLALSSLARKILRARKADNGLVSP